MSSTGSVTHWIGQLKAGDRAAAEQLWQRYFARLVRLACAKLHGAPRRAADEEDVALSAFQSFCRAAENNRFPQLADRNDLWQLLVLLTARKAYRHVQHERRKKRGGGKVYNASDLPGAGAEEDAALAQLIGPEPTPEFAAQAAEEYRRLLDRLGSSELRTIAICKMEGYSEEEVAARLGCVPRTVRRKLRRIRALWAEEIDHE